MYIEIYRGQVSKETVVLRQWEYSSESGNRFALTKGLTLETSASESLYGGQFTLSTQLIKPNYLIEIYRLIFDLSQWRFE